MAVINSGRIAAFVMAWNKFKILLIHIMSSIIPSFYASLASLTYIISLFSLFSFVEVFHIIKLNRVSLSANT